MTDEEYIRKAVGLAKGWQVDESLAPHVLTDGDIVAESLSGYKGALPSTRELMDALAAQLVRQVHDLSPVRASIYIVPASTTVYTKDGGDFKVEFEDSQAMNTIKAIIDSKMLEK